MGEEDLVCSTDEALDYSVSRIADAYRRFAQTADLQYEFLDEITDVSDTLRVATYANGARIVCNFADTPATFEGNAIPPHDFLRL